MSAEVLSFEGVTGPTSMRPIDLARVPAFRLGNLSVEPGMRRITVPGGISQPLEPRVMQVLIALARAEGAIVGRDELIRTCWNGTFVGDDAINRPISLLRRLSKGVGRGAFEIETIPRVGYRLLAGSRRGETQALPPPLRRGKAPLWTALAASTLVAGGVLAWPAAPEGPAYSISLQPFRAPAATDDFDDQLSSALTSLDVPTVGGRSALTLTGSVERTAGVFTANARLMTPGSHAVLWSGTISQPAVGPRQSAAVAARVATIAQCALAGANDAGNLAPELLSLYMRTCELGARGQNALGVKVARELTARAPDFAAGWFALSHHALALYLSEPRINAPLRGEALAAAEQLIALRPDAQDGYVSKAFSLNPRQRVERERLLRQATKLESIFVDRAQAALSDFLREVGRSDEAFQLDQLLARQNPTQADAQARLFISATATGRTTLADLALERVNVLDARQGQVLRWRKAVWHGGWLDAEHLQPRDGAFDGAIATYRALASGDAKRREEAAGKVMALPDDCCLIAKAELLTDLGRGPEAIAQLEKLDAGASGAPSVNLAAALANPGLRPLWLQPAIEPLLRHVGLIDYWRSSGTSPDMCRTAGAPAFCHSLTD